MIGGATKAAFEDQGVDTRRSGIIYAIGAAALFGASTPLAKGLLGQISPVLLAGMLYAGSGLGLGVWLGVRRLRSRKLEEASLVLRDLPWLAGAIVCGGVVGPILLMLGLAHTAASTASLLLNLESVLTAAIAWVVFRENVDRRIFLGMLAIVAGGILLSGHPDSVGATLAGVLGIAGACLCWAIDNNLTRAVSGGDPVQIAALKGVVAGMVNITLALALGSEWPALSAATAAAVIGFLGYGVSLVLFVLALRHLGTARTGAYFATAPFVGATLSLLLLHEVPALIWWVAGALMALGVWLHVSERHDHEHTHGPLEHSHRHRHDDHHQHDHDFSWDGTEPHTHAHVHAPITHKHPHFPDLHHRHRH
jgi:drug/metabolite transporter (DMT)-like permease